MKRFGKIYKRGRYYYVTIHDSLTRKSTTKSTGCTDLTDAEAVVAAMRAESTNPDITRKSVHFAEVLDSYVANRTPVVGKSRIMFIHCFVRRLKAKLGHRTVGSLCPGDFDSYFESFKGGFNGHRRPPTTAATFNKERAAIHALTNWCWRYKYMDRPIKLGLRAERSKKPPHPPPTDEQVNEIIKQAAGNTRAPYFAYFVRVMEWSGLRTMEVSGLRLDSFSLGECIWTIEERVKTKAPWVAPMHPYAHKVLTDWLKARMRAERVEWRANRNVWADSKPEVITTHMNRTWREACDRLGYPTGLQMRLLRRKYQNMLRRCGVPLEVYMRLCDHSDIQVAYRHYADITFEDQLQALAKVPAPDNIGVFGKSLPARSACAKVRTNEHTTNQSESPREDQLAAHTGGESPSEEESPDY